MTVDVMDGRTKEARAAKAAALEESDGEDITYFFREGDPLVVKWRGHEFRPNVPTRVRGRELISFARLNPFFFRVGTDPAYSAPREKPTTSVAYRAYVVDWMKSVQTVDQLAEHWAADRDLRERCEISQDDIIWLGTLFESKLLLMRKQEGLSETAAAAIWVKRGVLEIPWRA